MPALDDYLNTVGPIQRAALERVRKIVTAVAQIKRFPGQHGWYYIELDDELSKDLRPLLSNLWPALLKAEFTINRTVWHSSIMPTKDGPLFIALPAKVRKAEGLDVGDKIKVRFKLKV